MAGLPKETILECMVDLSKMHGQYFNSPILRSNPLLARAPSPPGADLKASDYSSPFLALSFLTYLPFPGNASGACGFEHAGETHRCPGGPCPFPNMAMSGEKGRA